MFTIFTWLLAGHALIDFPLQGEFVSKFKSRHTPSPEVIWPWLLSYHALMHGAAVALITGSPMLGFLEAVSHWLIDFGKCERWFGFSADQFAHIACKLLWAFIWMSG